VEIILPIVLGALGAFAVVVVVGVIAYGLSELWDAFTAYVHNLINGSGSQIPGPEMNDCLPFCRR
jgi:hypothetical protein